MSFASESVYVKQIEQKRDRGYDYLDIYTTGWTEARGLLLEDKLYIDFPGAKIAKNIRIVKRRSKRVINFQATQKDADTARLVVTLKGKIDYDIVNVFGCDKSVVEIGDRLGDILAYQFSWENKNIGTKGQPLKPVKLGPIRIEKEASLRGKTVILDPGHGGNDPGAFLKGEIPEKTLTLQTAQAAARLLREAGATVYLTRDEDRRSNLKDLVKFANQSGADIFISIHYNSIYHSGISGTETYYYNPVSRNFAQAIHAALVRGLKRKDRGLHRTPFYVVKETEMPSVLIEPIYLTNQDECALVKSASFQKKVAEELLKGVENYFRDKLR